MTVTERQRATGVTQTEMDIHLLGNYFERLVSNHKNHSYKNTGKILRRFVIYNGPECIFLGSEELIAREDTKDHNVVIPLRMDVIIQYSCILDQGRAGSHHL